MYTPEEIADRLQSWLQTNPPLPASTPATETFCRQRLQSINNKEHLTRKLDLELGSCPWRPLGRLLMVISENDILGTLAGFVAACLTGNRMLIKARYTLPLLQHLKSVFSFDDHYCEIRDWKSYEQNDTELLTDIDGILLAGSAELIQHYRRVTPPGIRLIEFGPKISVAAIWGNKTPSSSEWQNLIDVLVKDVTLFEQKVCSSPQCILVETLETAQALYTSLSETLPHLPPLSYEDRLLQMSQGQMLKLRSQLGMTLSVQVCVNTGWGVTLNQAFAPETWLPKGFQLIAGPLAPKLELLTKFYRHKLQTLGEWPSPSTLQIGGFTHRGTLGQMHERSLFAPHDGMLELPQFVNFIGSDQYP